MPHEIEARALAAHYGRSVATVGVSGRGNECLFNAVAANQAVQARVHGVNGATLKAMALVHAAAFDYSGGIICDWGTHLFDTAQWANNTELSGPVEVEGTGNYWSGGLFNTVKDYDVTFRYQNGVVMTCKPGNPSIKFIGSDGWVGNTGWRAPLQASSKEILNSVIGPEEIHL